MTRTDPQRRSATPTPTALSAAAAHRFWDEHRLLDDLDADILGQARTLEQIVSQHDMATVEAVLAGHQQILKAATDLPSLSVAMTQPDRQRLHRARNVLAAMLATACTAGKPVPAGLYAPPMRAGAKGRPATDDEILLMRTMALAYSRTGGRTHNPAVSYVLAEAGARPAETTMVRPCDFDKPRTPASVHLPGMKKGVYARDVIVPAWGRPVLALALEAHFGRGEPRHMHRHPLAYDGKHEPGRAKASASVTGNLKRLMRNAGIPADRLTATSITRWRIEKVATRDGLDAAHRLLGDRDYQTIIDAFLRRPVTPPVDLGAILDDDDDDM